MLARIYFTSLVNSTLLKLIRIRLMSLEINRNISANLCYSVKNRW